MDTLIINVQKLPNFDYKERSDVIICFELLKYP